MSKNPTLAEMKAVVGSETPALAHAEETVQSVYAGLSPEKRDLFDLLVGSAVEDVELPADDNLVNVYNSLSPKEGGVLSFLVGAALADEKSMEHGLVDYDEFLTHHGVKGMKWGVRRGDIHAKSPSSDATVVISKTTRQEIKDRVKSGEGTLLDAHLAALKSRGHRVTNALLGDKTYWKRAGVITAAAGAVVAATLLAPGAVPAGALYGAGVAIRAASTANSVTNLVRAVRGNSRIGKSIHEIPNAELLQRQTAGSKQVQKMLARNGSIKGNLLHSAMIATEDAFLVHYGIKGMKWGIRRSDDQLAALRNSDGEDIGTVHASSKAAGQRLKKMSPGEALVIDGEDGVKVVVKQKDGSFKEAKISADAERLVKTSNKQFSEMSDQEIKAANNRAQAIEQYNKLFNPLQDPNAELRSKVEALRLQRDFASIQAEMRGPTRSQKLGKLIKSVGPAFNEFQRLDKMTGGVLSKNLKESIDAFKSANQQVKSERKTAPKKVRVVAPAPKKKRSKGGPEPVYDISNIGRQQDFGNPFIPALNSGR